VFFCEIFMFHCFCSLQYLEEHVDQTYVDVGVMAKELQDKYTEYTRRKTVPFRILVEQGTHTIIMAAFHIFVVAF
jgi:ribosome biogenesis ATPase